LAFGSIILGVIAADSIHAAWGAPALAAAILGFIGTLAAMPFAKRQATILERQRTLIDLAERTQEHSALSDAAKRMLYRDRELDLLRMVIEQDIAANNFDAALHLVGELASHFGMLEEAENFRSRIEAARHAEVERRISTGVHQLNQALAVGDYDGARITATRLGRLFPDNPMVQELEERVQAVRRKNAAGLASSLDSARAEDRIDDAMRLLMELDRHVDGDEAQRLAPIAKAVIDRHREDLAERFRLALEDRRWRDALDLGETITSRYPNTRMAEEAGGMLEELRTRAR
jgi:hypothetical protein